MAKMVIALLITLNISQAQTLTYGFVVGTALTSDFGHRTFFYTNPVTGNIADFAETAASRGFILGGGLIEWHLSRRVSFEANALYRSLHFNETQFGPRDTVATWQLPVFLKHSFGKAEVLRPFSEVGPAFRTTGNLNSTSPSHTGLSAGVVINIHLRILDVAPGIRYTRWRTDTGSALYLSKSDQLELLIDFTRTFKIYSSKP